MNGWKFTRVWRIDNKLVVADTVEDATATYKTYMGKNCDEPTLIIAIGTDTLLKDYDAIIKED